MHAQDRDGTLKTFRTLQNKPILVQIINSVSILSPETGFCHWNSILVLWLPQRHQASSLPQMTSNCQAALKAASSPF